MAKGKENGVFKKAITTLKALDHNLRQDILTFIRNNPNTPVTNIYVKLRIEQSVTSQHLGILRKAGVLKTERDGKNILYSVNQARIDALIKLSNQITA